MDWYDCSVIAVTSAPVSNVKETSLLSTSNCTFQGICNLEICVTLTIVA